MNKIQVIAAHPDDEVLGCGATIARHARSGDRVQVVFVADGFSSRDNGIDRSVHAKEASKVLGCEAPTFLNFPDNQLDTVALLNIVKKIEKVIENFQPNIIYTHHLGDLNIDHQIVHKAAITACRPQPDFCVKEIYSFEVLSSTEWSTSNSFTPNYFVDISDTLKLKMLAIKAYDSELRSFPHARSLESIKTLAKYRGSSVGFCSVEAFELQRRIF